MAIFEDWLATSTYEACAESAHTADTAADRLRTLAHTTAQMMIDSAEFLPVQMEFWGHMLRNDAIRERFRSLFAELRTFLGQIIQTGIDSGEFRHLLRDPWSLTIVTLGVVMILALLAYTLSIKVSDVPTVVWDADSSPRSRGYLDALRTDDFFAFHARARSEAEVGAVQAQRPPCPCLHQPHRQVRVSRIGMPHHPGPPASCACQSRGTPRPQAEFCYKDCRSGA